MKSYKYLSLALIISTLPLMAIFMTADLPHTHDGAVHLPRMAAYFKALTDGQILPRWAGDLNYGYGLPLFNFIYHTPYLIASLFIGLGISLVISFKFLLALSYLLAATFMFVFARKLFKDEKTALLVTIFYQFAPFRLVEMLVRGSLGEIYVYAFAPLVLYGLTAIFEKATSINIFLTAVATLLLIISHNSMSLVFFSAIVLFLIFFAKSKKNFILGTSTLVLGLLGSLFYWLPALLEHKYTYGNLFMKDLFRMYFPTLPQLIIPNPLNLLALQNQGVSVQIGAFHLLALIIAFFVLLRKKKLSEFVRKITILSLILTGISLFFVLPVSLPVWNRMALLRQFQFPWRFLALTALTSSLASSSFMFFSFFRKPIIYWSLICLTVISTAYFWKPVLGFDRVTDEKAAYWNYPLDTTYFGETDVIWSAGPAKAYPAERVQAIEGQAKISHLVKRTALHTFDVSSTASARLVDKTGYFPGWRVYIDNIKTPIEFQDQNWRGLITFAVPAGTHSVKVIFEKSPVQFISEIISILTLISLGIILLLGNISHISFKSGRLAKLKL